MQLPRFSITRNNLVTAMLMSFIMFVMVTPVLANSINWSFLAYYNGRVINGKANGVPHQMTAGAMTIKGTIKTTAVYGTPPFASPWFFEVRDWSTDQVKCSAGPVAVPLLWNQTTSFSKACGSVPAGTYYLYIYRGQADDREVTGSGTLVTK